MVEEITSPGYDRLGRVGGPKARKAGDKKPARRGTNDREAEATAELPGELQGLIDRVRRGETHRLERVHEVLEKIQRGELVSSETVRQAAERILRGGI